MCIKYSIKSKRSLLISSLVLYCLILYCLVLYIIVLSLRESVELTGRQKDGQTDTLLNIIVLTHLYASSDYITLQHSHTP